MKIKIKNKELMELLIGDSSDFPLYTSQILNLANQNAQGTRPKVVGQLSELINECPEKTYSGWKKWYLSNHPDAIENATARIEDMVAKLKIAFDKIDKPMIKKWVEDLVLEKTYIGLRFQPAILKKIAEIKKSQYRIANPQEESKGIDGYIDDVAVSIKPHSYKTKKSLRENIAEKNIYYEKKKEGLDIDVSELD